MPRKVIRRKRLIKRAYGGARTSRAGFIVNGRQLMGKYPSIARSLASGVYYFKRTVNSELDSANCVVDGVIAVRDTTNNCFYVHNPLGSAAGTKLYGTMTYQFSIESLPSLGDFTNLFDAYRINAVKIRIIPRATSVDTSSPGATSYQEGPSPIIHYVKDYDDATAPAAAQTGLNELRQYPSYKAKRLVGNKPIKIILRPKPVATTYGYATGLLLNPRKMGAWMNCAHTNLKHYGLKSIIEYIAPSGSTAWRCNFEIETTYYMAFKGVR